jgi:hypothetical protein
LTSNDNEEKGRGEERGGGGGGEVSRKDWRLTRWGWEAKKKKVGVDSW